MFYIILIFIIILLLLKIYNDHQKINKISLQVNQILFQQIELYTQYYSEGSISILENEISKLVTRLYEKNNLLKKDKILLKQSLEDISHQMKTPLTSLQLIQERLKEAEGTEKRQLLHEQQLLLSKIDWLVQSLLKLAQLDANTVIFQKETISQSDFIQQLIKPFEVQLELKDIQLNIQENQQELSYIDIKWTLEALSNIFKNCVEHLPMNGKITVSMKDNPLYHEIIIQDNGKGIDKEDLPHLFERFYKGKNATTNSVGIGLSLSQMIIEKQKGTIMVENTYPGAKFTIHFYKEVI